MKSLLRYGNHKIPKSTVIFNMGSAKKCPARRLKLCSVVNRGITCYARRTELLRSMGYDMVVKYRGRQEKYWKETPKEVFAERLIAILKNKRVKITHFRFNESGDFWSQECVNKLSYIAGELKKKLGVVTYGYTARSDLNFKKVNFLVKGSENNAGNNGRVQIIEKNEPVPKGYKLCEANCRICNYCKVDKKINIAIRRH